MDPWKGTSPTLSPRRKYARYHGAARPTPAATARGAGWTGRPSYDGSSQGQAARSGSMRGWRSSLPGPMPSRRAMPPLISST